LIRTFLNEVTKPLGHAVLCPPQTSASFSSNAIIGAMTMTRVIYHGFQSSLLIWVIAMGGHIPVLHIPPLVNGLALIAVFVVSIAWSGRGLHPMRALRSGAWTGLLVGLLNLLLLGSMLVEQPTAGSPREGFAGLRPDAWWIVGGFLVVCGISGAIAGGIGAKALRSAAPSPSPNESSADWIARFAKLMACSLIPLILIGGMVTSADAGMSVRGWPGSDGAVMFLYPISLMTDARVFFEHSHRLMGSLVGLTMLTGMVWVLVAERRSWPRMLAVGLFVLICVQGYLGGSRVNLDSRVLGLVHGIGAQVIMALAWVLAAGLSSASRRETVATPHPLAGRVRKISTALLICLVIQLALGAAFRHLGAGKPGMIHMIYTHAVLAMGIVVLASLAGFGLRRAATDMIDGGNQDARAAKRTGGGLVHAVMAQFMLGWATFWVVLNSRASGAVPGPSDLASTPKVPVWEAIAATLHQTLGAVILSMAAMTAFWAWRAIRPMR
jgi:heme a synthase